MAENSLLRLIPNKKDPMSIRDIINTYVIDFENVLKKYYTQLTELLIEAVTDTEENVEDLVLLSYTPNQFNRKLTPLQLQAIKNFENLSNSMVKKSYTRGKITALNQLNRVAPKEQPVTFTGLSQSDIRTIRLLQDSDFSLIKTLNQQQIATAKRIYVEGLTNAKSRDQIVSEIMNTIGSMAYQTKRIVYTESIRSTVTAARKLYLQSGFTHWAWNTALDERVCPVCSQLHGKVVKIGESWNKYLLTEASRKKNGTNNILQPPAHPMCRCGVFPAPAPPVKGVAKIVEKVKEIPKKIMELVGFSKNERSGLKKHIKRLPEEVKEKSSLLNGTNPIIKGEGSIVNIKEAKDIIPDVILKKYIRAHGIYVGGIHKKAFLSAWSTEWDILHEIGHSIYDEYVSSKQGIKTQFTKLHNDSLDKGKFITERSSADKSEHFADLFTAYLLEPTFLLVNYPALYVFMDNNIFYEGGKK